MIGVYRAPIIARSLLPDWPASASLEGLNLLGLPSQIAAAGLTTLCSAG